MSYSPETDALLQPLTEVRGHSSPCGTAEDLGNDSDPPDYPQRLSASSSNSSAPSASNAGSSMPLDAATPSRHSGAPPTSNYGRPSSRGIVLSPGTVASSLPLPHSDSPCDSGLPSTTAASHILPSPPHLVDYHVDHPIAQFLTGIQLQGYTRRVVLECHITSMEALAAFANTDANVAAILGPFASLQQRSDLTKGLRQWEREAAKRSRQQLTAARRATRNGRRQPIARSRQTRAKLRMDTSSAASDGAAPLPCPPFEVDDLPHGPSSSPQERTVRSFPSMTSRNGAVAQRHLRDCEGGSEVDAGDCTSRMRTSDVQPARLVDGGHDGAVATTVTAAPSLCLSATELMHSLRFRRRFYAAEKSSPFDATCPRSPPVAATLEEAIDVDAEEDEAWETEGQEERHCEETSTSLLPNATHSPLNGVGVAAVVAEDATSTQRTNDGSGVDDAVHEPGEEIGSLDGVKLSAMSESSSLSSILYSLMDLEQAKRDGDSFDTVGDHTSPAGTAMQVSTHAALMAPFLPEKWDASRYGAMASRNISLGALSTSAALQSLSVNTVDATGPPSLQSEEAMVPSSLGNAGLNSCSEDSLPAGEGVPEAVPDDIYDGSDEAGREDHTEQVSPASFLECCQRSSTINASRQEAAVSMEMVMDQLRARLCADVEQLLHRYNEQLRAISSCSSTLSGGSNSNDAGRGCSGCSARVVIHPVCSTASDPAPLVMWGDALQPDRENDVVQVSPLTMPTLSTASGNVRETLPDTEALRYTAIVVSSSGSEATAAVALPHRESSDVEEAVPSCTPCFMPEPSSVVEEPTVSSSNGHAPVNEQSRLQRSSVSTICAETQEWRRCSSCPLLHPPDRANFTPPFDESSADCTQLWIHRASLEELNAVDEAVGCVGDKITVPYHPGSGGPPSPTEELLSPVWWSSYGLDAIEDSATQLRQGDTGESSDIRHGSVRRHAATFHHLCSGSDDEADYTTTSRPSPDAMHHRSPLLIGAATPHSATPPRTEHQQNEGVSPPSNHHHRPPLAPVARSSTSPMSPQSRAAASLTPAVADIGTLLPTASTTALRARCHQMGLVVSPEVFATATTSTAAMSPQHVAMADRDACTAPLRLLATRARFQRCVAPFYLHRTSRLSGLPYKRLRTDDLVDEGLALTKEDLQAARQRAKVEEQVETSRCIVAALAGNAFEAIERMSSDFSTAHPHPSTDTSDDLAPLSCYDQMLLLEPVDEEAIVSIVQRDFAHISNHHIRQVLSANDITAEVVRRSPSPLPAPLVPPPSPCPPAETLSQVERRRANTRAFFARRGLPTRSTRWPHGRMGGGQHR